MRPSEGGGGGGGARRMSSQTIWAAVLVAFGVFVYQSQERSGRAIARSTKDIADLREALIKLDDRLAQSSRRGMRSPFEMGGGLHASLDQAPLPPSEGQPGKQPHYEEDEGEADDADGAQMPRTPKSAIEEVAPIIEALEQTYQADPVDASWSRTANNMLQHFWLPKMPAGGRLGPVDCRSTVCRVESTFESEPQMNEFVYEALSTSTRRPWNWSMTTGPVRQDPVTKRVTMVTFLMRDTGTPDGTTVGLAAAVP